MSEIEALKKRIAELEADNRLIERERHRLAAENIDLKNRLADIKHEIEMNSWLK